VVDKPAQHSFLFSGPGARLDVWLSEQIAALSRSRLQSLIRSGHVLVNGQPRKPHYELREGDAVEVTVPPPEPVELVAQEIPLHVLFEDDDVVVINKPAGLVVHPAAGHASGTLVNALLAHCGGSLAGIGGELRPGIVHRLDKDTTGVLVVAKNDAAMSGLAAQFKGREVRKQYLALVWGRPEPESGTIKTLVGRSPHDRKKMSAKPLRGRPAVTHYETMETFAEVSVLRLRIETGRTHQIRVHAAHIGHPVVGDRQYGRARGKVLPVEPGRQMLHAERLAFTHPRTGLPLEFAAPLPEDFALLLRALREEKRGE
jgi:23S rRNA pseudouridine1911/1915/1917 synthase